MKFIAIASVILFSFSSFAQPAWQSEFEKYIDDVVATYHLPGIAVEVVGANGPIMQVTRGYRDIANKKPVTPETLYAIGSTSKAFTGVLLAQLRDQGKLDFDQTVQTYWPEFHIQDLKALAALTIHDLASHWTGVGRNDFAWYQRDLTRQNMLDLIPYLPVSAAPRTTFLYNNFMWVALGRLSERLSGKGWEAQLQEQILNPLGMSQTIYSADQMKLSANHAEPYAVDLEGKVTQVPLYDIGFANPAGGIYSNLNDMAKWVQLQLNEGRARGIQIVSKESLVETHKGYSNIAPGQKYGMGWMSLNINGHDLLTHDGGIDGFLSNVSFFPKDGFGVVVLMNTAQFPAQTIATRMWMHMLGMPAKDLVAIVVAKEKENQAKAREEFADPAIIKPTADLSDYAGKFCNEGYGTVTITNPASDRLHVKFNAFDKDLMPYGDGQMFMAEVFEALKFLSFDASKNSLQWMLEDSLHAPIEFKRCG